MEGANGLKVLNLQMGDLVRQMENAIQFGQPVLLQVCATAVYCWQGPHPMGWCTSRRAWQLIVLL